jgi:membrane fusion protein, multidrug efflux system
MGKRMLIMLAAVVVIFGGVFGYKIFTARMMAKYMHFQAPPAVVTAMTATYQVWQPRLKAVGSLRAVKGVDVSSEIPGMVRTVRFKAGDEAAEGQVLVELNADSDTARLQALQAAAELARTVYERDKKQFAVQAVSQATLDTDAADLKSRQAQADEQRAVVEKKTIKAPFAGRLGISTVNPGQYVNPGEKLVTLQALDALFCDFSLPQQELSRLAPGQKVAVASDGSPGRTFDGAITAVDPKVDPDTRNVRIEARIVNKGHTLLPGMYATVEVKAGKTERYLTLPQTAVTYNPYGDTVFIIEQGAAGPQGKPALTVKEAFVTVGPTRGDQVAILTGVKEGDRVVTSGQLKLKNGSGVIIDNTVRPSNEAAPKPEDE